MEMQSVIGSTEQFVKTFFKSSTDDMQMCIEKCLQCAQVCEYMVQHCLKRGGLHADARHIRILQDCAEMCRVTANFIMRESDLHVQTCRTCALVCLICAADCERLADDEIIRMCAEICRQCADSCQKINQRASSIEIQEV